MFRTIVYLELSFVYTMRKQDNMFLFNMNTKLFQQEFLKTLLFSHYSQFSSVQSLSRVQLCDHMNRSTTGLPVHHLLPEFTQTHVHRVDDAI